jgi:hypothetical protein
MKYIITESQFNKTVFIYLDNQDFILIETIEDIYFLNSEEDKNAQIRYNKGRWCFITFELIDEISSFFSLDEDDSQEIIGLWIEDTLKIKISNIFPLDSKHMHII